jgi:hypothetical protein
MYTNVGILKFIKYTLVDLKSQIDSSTAVVEGFKTSLSPTDMSSKQKIKKLQG